MRDLLITGTAGYSMKHVGRWTVMGFERGGAAVAYVASREVARKLTLLTAHQNELVGALKGMMEIAETAMPDTYFQSDSRVNAAREILEKLSDA